MIETGRLILRPFVEADRAPFAEINGDPRVGDWLGGTLDRAASDALLDRLNTHVVKHGFGFWAAERKADGRLVGMIGLQWLAADLPPAPGIEMGWRLAFDVQGLGLATEGASAALSWGFANLAEDEIVAFTAARTWRHKP
jgi:RimJ/RimL family protein N-acetyltransferase